MLHETTARIMFSRFIFISLCVIAVVGLIVPLTTDAHAASKSPKLVLGMRVESLDLAEKDKAALFVLLQSTLAKYPKIQSLDPPEGEITDEMIEFECMDIDASCLSKVGKKYKASMIVYTQVDAIASGFQLTLRVVKVRSRKSVRNVKRKVANIAALGPMLEKQLIAAFGRPPKPKLTHGVAVLKTPADSSIYLNGKFVGKGEVKLELAKGAYVVRVHKDGFQDAMFELNIELGKTVERLVELKVLGSQPPTLPIPLPAEVDEEPGTPFYSSWWFWTTVGAAVLGGSAAALVLTLDTSSPPMGGVQLSVDPEQAWRDVTVIGGTFP